MRSIVQLGAAIGEPARAKMLAALMDGRALTATELALEAGVSPATASSHLARLRGAGLIEVAAQGRHRYFRLAGTDVAALLETMMSATSPRVGPRGEALREARVCYDHLAGARGVALLERMRAKGLVRGELELTQQGEAWAAARGIDVAALRGARRPVVRACLDWSERRMHLAGALGAALLQRLFTLKLARRAELGRAVIVSPRAESFLQL